MRELYDSQKAVLNEVSGRTKCAFYCAPGTGKTLMGLTKMREVGNSHNLIVCQKSKVEDWIEDASEQFPTFDVIDYTKQPVPSDISDMGDFIGVINYDKLWRRKEFLQWYDFNLLLDESSLIQNRKSKRTEFVTKLHQTTVQLLSGTPVSGKYENLYTQMQLLGYKKSYTGFMNRYVKYELLDTPGFMNKKYVHVYGYKNVDHLKQTLKELGCTFRRLEEMADLPEATTQTIYVKPPKEYKKFMKDRIITVGEDTLVGDSSMSMLIYARQLCSCYNPEKETVLRDLLDSLENERVIIFYSWKKDLAVIQRIVGNRPFSQINGDVKDRRAFRENPNGVIAIQYQAGAMGENLQEAAYIIYWALPLKSDDWEQSHDRIHRIGQTRKQVYYEILTAKSVEINVRNTLELRQDYTLALFTKEQ